MPVSSKPWGRTPYREDVLLFTLENSTGCKARISTYGATLTGLEIPVGDKNIDLVLGFDSLEEYMTDGNYFGATIGRVAGRISNAAFELDGQKYQLDRNEGSNHLHGGKYGFNRRNWKVLAQNEDAKSPSLTLELHCKDGMGGYPGNVRIETTFTLNSTSLSIVHRAQCDTPAPLNMTNHPYFNLNGGGHEIDNHELKIFSAKSTTFDKALIPDGRLIETCGSEADFSNFTPLGKTVQDRFFILDKNSLADGPAAIVRCKESGLELEISTNQRGVQLYTADGIAAGTKGKNGQQYGPRCGLCIEPMGYPDAVNRPEFPSVILHPGERYNHSTEYRFRPI
ncbi:aldose epimerase family protein [Desulfovibrio sp. JC010]|uniref:aldose epimerase family protein n=1 Tax=Desulfovibrio sp. JC010 TaxID=2593641 RepID=UPI0013D83E21|nr:aldose epimerase family protein [Desulfovibrio sp. JC010]NDV26771.1 galactose mutarotase [Desulfovibrio sp. JC010]